MRNPLIKFSAIVLMLCYSGCADSSRHSSFSLHGKLTNGRSAKTAYLYEYLPEYKRIKLVDSVPVTENRFTVNGHTDGIREAFVRFDNDTTPFFLLLDHADLQMTIGQNASSVSGTDANRRYTRLTALQRNGANIRFYTQQEYRQMIQDSTLTRHAEDSLLQHYRHTHVELQQEILKVMAYALDSCPPLADLTYRTMVKYLTPVQADSIEAILKPKKPHF